MYNLCKLVSSGRRLCCSELDCDEPGGPQPTSEDHLWRLMGNAVRQGDVECLRKMVDSDLFKLHIPFACDTCPHLDILGDRLLPCPHPVYSTEDLIKLARRSKEVPVRRLLEAQGGFMARQEMEKELHDTRAAARGAQVRIEKCV